MITSPRFIAVASSKGGIGKSTAALGISRALCARGKKVLLADLDYGNACLDMLCRVEDSVLYTSADVSRGICTPEEAVIKPEGEGLFLLAAPSGGRTVILPGAHKDKDSGPKTGAENSGGNSAGNSAENGGADGAADKSPTQLKDGIAEDILTESGFAADADSIAKAVRDAAVSVGADRVILDTGAGVSGGFIVAASLSSQALVVAGHSPVSLRSAESTAERLSVSGVSDVRLIINNFDGTGVLRRSPFRRSGIFNMIDTARIPLAGVIPYDYDLTLSHEGGGRGGALSEAAFANIAARIEGENVPLFSGMKHYRKIRKKLYI